MITVLANDRHRGAYKRLLVAEWKKDFPEKVLSLLWSTIQAGQGPLLPLLDPARDGSFPADYFRSLLERIEDGSKFFVLRGLPSLPPDYPPSRRLSRAAWQANRLATYLTLPAHTELSGELAFFRDLQALAFQAAIHFLLPTLREKHPPEHAILLHALALFPLVYYSFDPGHFYYLISMLHDYLGNVDERLRFLYASFRFTRPEDHSFLTKGQELWSELLDHRRYEEAEKFLLSLDRWSLPHQADEVREMIVDGFRLIQEEKSLSH